MTKYILKRLSMMIMTLFLIILLTFILMHSVPGGPFTRDKQVAPAVLEAPLGRAALAESVAKLRAAAAPFQDERWALARAAAARLGR